MKKSQKKQKISDSTLKKQEYNYFGKKKSFLEKRLDNLIEPIIDKLLYACFYQFVETTGNPNNILYDEYCIIIRDLLNCNLNNESECE